MLTYTFDDSYTAQLTMKKLIEAQKRGVQVTLMVDDLNQTIEKSLKNQFIENGGVFHSLNPCFKLWKLFNRSILHRHHEKLILIDNKTLVGSSNIADEYSGYKFGMNFFTDIVQVSKNMYLDESREYFKKIADYYQLNLHPEIDNNEILKKYNQVYPDSKYDKEKYYFSESNYYEKPYKRDIQERLIKMINNSKSKITMVQPYYYSIKKIEKALQNALSRGVEVELITSSKRDQPCYKTLNNYLLTQKLINRGLKVYELHNQLLHMKLYIFDDQTYTLGSFNNDRISWRINNELNLFVDDKEQTQIIQNEVDLLRNQCVTVNEKTGMVGNIKFAKIKFWEFVLRCGDWLGYKNYQKRFDKHFKTSNFKKFYDWDGNLELDYYQ